jgi:hypothetical protein
MQSTRDALRRASDHAFACAARARDPRSPLDAANLFQALTEANDAVQSAALTYLEAVDQYTATFEQRTA